MSFLIAPQVTGLSSEISMEGATWTFTHLEDTRTGLWYGFVRPFEQMAGHVAVRLGHYDDHTAVRVPVLYRRYPMEPALLSQEAIGMEGGGMEDRLAWMYRYQMRAALVAQDRLYVELLSNGSGGFYRRARQQGSSEPGTQPPRCAWPATPACCARNSAPSIWRRSGWNHPGLPRR